MKNIKVYIGALAFLMLSITSCKMDTAPSSSLGSGEAFSSVTDMDNSILSVYDNMINNNYYDGRLLTAGDFMGDDVRQSYASSSHLNTFYDYSWTKIAANTSVYFRIYFIIAHINDTLERSEAIKDSPEKTVKVAELKALRAMAHFDISKLYAPLPVMLGKGSIKPDVLAVPIMDKSQPVKETDKMLRQPVSKVYDFVISELLAVLPNLPKGKVAGRLGQDGAKAVLARAYLYKGDYANAYKYANELITSGTYELISRDNYVASFGVPYDSESIFELDSTSEDNNGINSMGYYVYAKGTQGYKEMVASAHFEELLSKDASDIRLQIYVPPVVDDPSTKDIDESKPAIPGIFVPYSDNKTKGVDYFPTNKWPGREGNMQINNIVVYRLSEMYLIAAESAMRNGDVSRAKVLIDKLRANRIKDYDPASTPFTGTIEEILYERRVELFGEGHRAFDLRRNLMDVVRFKTNDERESLRYERHSHLTPGIIPFDYFRNWLPFVESQLVLFPEEVRDAQQTPGY